MVALLPEKANVKPGGNVPELIDQLYGADPPVTLHVVVCVKPAIVGPV
jgi:hypothetical protein